MTHPDAERLRLKFAWVRWALGVVAAIAASLLIVSVTISENQIAGCGRSVSERIATAKKDAADATREYLLSLDVDIPVSQRIEHKKSAGVASEAALAIAHLTGLDLKGSTEDKINTLRGIDLASVDIKQSTSDYCKDLNPRPFPFIK